MTPGAAVFYVVTLLAGVGIGFVLGVVVMWAGARVPVDQGDRR
jgi:hypothetical protein